MKIQNSTLIIGVAGLLVLFAFIGIIAISGRDVDQYVGSITTILALFGLGTGLNQRLSKVDRQTNGTLSRKDDELSKVHAENKELREQLAAKTGATYVSAEETANGTD